MLREPDVVWLRVGEPEDPRLAVTRSPIVPERELLEKNGIEPSPGKRAQCGHPHNSAAHDDNITVQRHLAILRRRVFLRGFSMTHTFRVAAERRFARLRPRTRA